MLVENVFNWWVGVVEDRNDPEKLGRVKVRIIGAHSDNKDILPTADLPWAITMQPTTSAAVSGIGSAPVGLLQGTWCIGFFIDGKDMQQPIIMGTLGGLPKSNPVCEPQLQQQKTNPPNVVRATDGLPVLNSFGNPIISEPSSSASSTKAEAEIQSDLPPLSKDQIQAIMDEIAKKATESVAGGVQNYSTESELGFIGKYQMGAEALVELGYVKGTPGQKLPNSILSDPNNWTNKDGVDSKETFLKSTAIQETAMFQSLKLNYNALKTSGVLSANDEPGKVAGLLAVSHLLGASGAASFADGKDSKDENGVSGQTYYQIGALSVGNIVPSISKDAIIPLNVDPAGPLNDIKATKPQAFSDPNNEYPKCDYNNLGDTNKLATGDTTQNTPIEKRSKARRQKVAVVSGDKWDEPIPAYCAKYPYNQTFQTEAGHLVEFDNTPGHERIHLYHKSGTYIEVDVNGTMVKKSVGDNYEIVEHNNYLYTRGAYHLTVEGATQILVKNSVDLKVYGPVTAVMHDNFDVRVAGNINMVSGQYFNIDTKQMNINGRNINFNATNKLNMKALMGYNVQSLGSFNMQTGTGVAITAGTGFDVQTATSATFSTGMGFNVASGTNIGMDATTILMNSGAGISSAATSIASSTKSIAQAIKDIADNLPPILGAAPPYKKVDSIDIPPMQRPDCDPDAFTLDAGEEGADKINAKQLAEGKVTQSTPAESGSAEAPINTAQIRQSNCSEFASFNEFPDSIKLSKYFTLGVLSSKAAVVNEAVISQRGYSQQQIVCNLKNLAVNCLDKIKDQYPDMFVTNAFRRDREGKTSSDHGIGMAADIQFRNAKQSDYYNIVQWVAANVPYKQLLLEYGGGARNPWIHIAFDVSGQKHPLPYATFKDHKVYARNKFVNLAG